MVKPAGSCMVAISDSCSLLLLADRLRNESLSTSVRRMCSFCKETLYVFFKGMRKITVVQHVKITGYSTGGAITVYGRMIAGNGILSQAANRVSCMQASVIAFAAGAEAFRYRQVSPQSSDSPSTPGPRESRSGKGRRACMHARTLQVFALKLSPGYQYHFGLSCLGPRACIPYS